MKVTARELVAVVILAVVGLTAAVYMIYLGPAYKALQEARVQLELLREQESQVEVKRAAIPVLLEEQETLIKEIDEKTRPFFPNLIEDRIVSLLAGTVTRGGPDVTTITVEELTATDLATIGRLTAAAPLEYPLGDLAKTILPPEASAPEPPLPVGVLMSRGVTVDFGVAGYGQVLTQMSMMEATGRTITVDFMSLTNGEEGLAGSLHYNFYGLAKLSDTDGGLVPTPLTDAQGKGDPFN